MATSSTAGDVAPSPGRCPSGWPMEVLGILTLVALAVYFLVVSWRKWPDPIADSGTQWYTFWRLSQGARLYHDVVWNYGPLSAFLDGQLFKWFGPGMMVLVTANLVIYAAISALAYLAFRRAWGPLGAFAALAVFISVFSFSRLNSIANYNYATPYANESTHGMLLILVTAFVAVRWCRGPSRRLAFVLGLCGGLATVLKPEFMLAGGVLGLAACAIRLLQKQRPGIVEWLLLAAGIVLPTLVFTIIFARDESFKAALIDAGQAWWLVVVEHTQSASAQQQFFLGLDRPSTYALAELQASFFAALAVGAIWAAGWLVNRPLSMFVRIITALAALALVYFLRPAGGWLNAGAALPGLVAVIFVVLALRARREWMGTGRVTEGTLMALALTLVAGAMLARMLLHARVTHLGFYQAAFAGMAVAAFLVAEVPRWTGPDGWGRCLTMAGCIAVLATACTVIARQSHRALVDQTVAIGTGRDRFYASVGEVDQIGPLVNWVLDQMQAAPPSASVCVMPEGAMINYLLRRPSASNPIRTEPALVEQFDKTPPDYVVFISRDLREYGIKKYGELNGPGFVVLQWLRENHYAIEAGVGGDPLNSEDPKGKGAFILHRPAATNSP